MDWYEELDYEENPFKDNEDTELIGYEELIDEVLYRVASGNMVCVEGKSGAGKTAILKAAINKFKGTGRLVYINGQQFDNGLNIEKILKKKAGLMKRLFNKKPKNMILLLDEVQNLSQTNCERIKYYFDNNFIKSAVFTSSDLNKANFTTSLKERMSKTIRLREIMEDEAVDIVQSRLGSDEVMSEEIIKEIFNRTNKNMKIFLKNCEELCAFALENNGKTVLPEHLKEFFDEKVEELSENSENEEPEKEVNKKIKKKAEDSQNKSGPVKKKKLKKNKKPNSAKKKTKEDEFEDPRQIVEEPVTVSIVNDFKPQKKGVKMEDGTQDEEIDIDDELKKLGKASKLEDDEDLSTEDYEEDYKDFQEIDDEDEEELKKVSDEEEGTSEKDYER
ncbi:MAG: ATP-binding protein [Candidatus Aenigmarchaeota archaeon]|nr:ATP-binding protein [Candidatus Aenigmarchaeota archaeon]